MVSRRQLLACRAHEMRRNMTPQEKKLWYGFLCEYSPSFRCQKVIGNYIVDFYCRKVRLCVEVDGGHHNEAVQKRHDETRGVFLDLCEIKQLRFTNREVDDEFEGVCEVIHQTVLERRHDLRSISLSSVQMKR